MTRLLSQYLLILVSCCFIDCRQTKLFKKIEITGRLLNYYSKEPITYTTVHLLADDAHSAKDVYNASVQLATVKSDENGLFVIKCNQSKKTAYYIKTDEYDPYKHGLYDTTFNSSDSKINLGNIYGGNHDVVFKIHMRPTSGYCARANWFYPNSVNLSSSTDTNIVIKINWYYSVIKDIGRSLFYSVKSLNCNNQTTLSTTSYSIPVYTADTIKYNINF